MDTKKEFRQTVRELKKQYSQKQLEEFSQTILSHLEEDDHFKEAKTVLIYSSLPDEVQTAAFIEKWYAQKQLLLPKVEGELLSLHPYSGPQSMKKGMFGILEPQTPPFLDFQKLDLAVVPGMAFDKCGNRLGRGRGFYDRLLTSFLPYHIYIIGIAFPFQIFDKIPATMSDMKMDTVLFK